MKQSLHKYIIMILTLVMVSCKSTTETEVVDAKLTLVDKFQLKIGQPSGITFNNDYSGFWIVDGESERICKTDLSGNILQKLNYRGDDIEGIFYDRKNPSLWIVEEESREVIHLDLDGNEIGRFKTDITGTVNNGLEGIALDDQQNLWVLNEKNPSALIALSSNYSSTTKFGLPFAKDLSDMDYNTKTKNFFVLSDESKAFYIWNTTDGLKAKYDLPYSKGEGITINPNKNTIVIVNDSLSTMYQYELK